jgi:hypothetical protein
MTASIVILQLAVLAVVLESDLGRRKIGWFRVLRPVVTVIIIIPFFFTSLPVGGNDLILQVTGAVVGALLGLLSVSPLLVSVSYEPAGRRHWFGRDRARTSPADAVLSSVSRAGLGYAVIWIAVTVARLGFAYGAQHVFPADLGQFLTEHTLSSSALANAFIFLSVGMDLFRSLLLWARGRGARLAAVVPAEVTRQAKAAR